MTSSYQNSGGSQRANKNPERETPERETPETEDQREEYRLTGRVAVAIEVEAAQSGQPARILQGKSRDISASGVSLNAPEALPEGALLPVTLTLDQEEPLALMGEVRWCEPRTSGPGYRIGLTLLDSDETAYLEWKEAMARLLAMD